MAWSEADLQLKDISKIRNSIEHIKVECKDTSRYPNFYKTYTDTAQQPEVLLYTASNKKSRLLITITFML
ncbi:MAG: hypothetical protein ACLVFL_09650 [Eubacterium sp.]